VSRANVLFELVWQGKLHPDIGASFPLADGVTAHYLLESRRSTGKVFFLAAVMPAIAGEVKNLSSSE